ncbi:MAG: zinc-binding dehydrogenase [Leptolinea sp.]|jgi:NADPH:quinone reductase-like Zn-dependent oxidoreductase|nr:zinc-binding dehydrogenase [Leptolinea sp.]
MKYKRVVAVKIGGPQVLQIQDFELREPSRDEFRIKIQAVPVCLPDVQARYGLSPYPPRIPFTPGYAVIGVIDAVGDGERRSTFRAGDRVAALTVIGGYSEYIFLKKNQLIPVPSGIDAADAAVLILNYMVAYQVLHRSARVTSGSSLLIIGASGGIGTALLQLGKLAGLKMYGLASKSKHAILEEYGAAPIDYHTQDFVEVLRQLEPGGIDVVADGMGGDYYNRGLSVLGKGGVLVEYGNPLGFSHLLRLLGKTLTTNLRFNGKTVKLYGTSFSVFNRRPFLEDWEILFSLLAAGKIKPVIEHRYAILDAPEANARLESGRVTGNLVLLSPEIL